MTSNPFDPTHDYFEDLKDSEKYKDDRGREYPYLRGLQRLAHNNRGGVKAVYSQVHKTPSVGMGAEDVNPDCIASATVTYKFHDGTEFQGSADASYKAHDTPFSLHLVAVAESKAEARAIRRAFNISKVAKEEIGDASVIEEDGPATDAQIEGIKKLAKRKKLSKADVLRLAKLTNEVEDIQELTSSQARVTIKAIQRYKMKA